MGKLLPAARDKSSLFLSPLRRYSCTQDKFVTDLAPGHLHSLSSELLAKVPVPRTRDAWCCRWVTLLVPII